MKLIDADKLKLSIRDDAEINGSNYARMKMHINDAETVDAVTVMRCKDCDAYSTVGCADGFGWCQFHDRPMMDNDFCSHGGRITDGN